MSFCRFLGFGLRPYLNVSSECSVMKRLFEVKNAPEASSYVLLKKFSSETEKKTSKNHEIVYIGPLTRQIRSVKLFSLLSSFTGVFAQPVIYEKAQEIGTSTPMLIAVCSFVGFFTFVTPVLLHFITKKYVTSIEYNSKDDSYKASIYTLFIRKKEISFKPGEAVVPDVLGMFTSMTIRGIPLFIDARFFDDLHHYKKIMGYDKPMDFKINNTEKKNITESH
ncbi:unnamed protein product [Nezara viridula]|uniref:Transmembrane protein 70 homolog, mitochondrial n=1 Tax=Nezara viridula TaxID=85310 RepID=A0A9P0EE63_NEZVI|nr:unnamed protein product [Nezara viridula]